MPDVLSESKHRKRQPARRSKSGPAEVHYIATDLTKLRVSSLTDSGHQLAASDEARRQSTSNKKQTRSTRGAYLGEGADNGHGGRSPPLRRPHDGSSSVSMNGSRSASPFPRPHVRFTGLHQSSAPSFHHVDVGLGGGYGS